MLGLCIGAMVRNSSNACMRCVLYYEIPAYGQKLLPSMQIYGNIILHALINISTVRIPTA